MSDRDGNASKCGSMLARRRAFADDYPLLHKDNSKDPGTEHRQPNLEEEGRRNHNKSQSRHSSRSSLSESGSDMRGSSHNLIHVSSKESSESLEEDVEVEEQKIAGQPVNFGIVIPGIYRSGYPQADDLEFLETLHLKTIVSLVQKGHSEVYRTFIESSGIRHIVLEMQGTKKVQIPQVIMNSIMEVLLDKSNYPLLVHCNHGKHRTGCVVAVIRLIMGWPMELVLDEYESYAKPKVREADLSYIRTFQLESLGDIVRKCAFEGPRGPIVRHYAKLTTIALLTAIILGLCAVTLILF